MNNSVVQRVDDEQPQMMFLDAVEVANGNTAVGTGTIVDDEAIPPVVNIGSATIREGDVKTRPAKLIVTLTKTSSQTVTVNYATVTGTATRPLRRQDRPADIQAGTGVQGRQRVGEGYTTPELDESFTVHLSRQVNTLTVPVVGVPDSVTVGVPAP